MAKELIDKEYVLSHPFANGHYDHEQVAKSERLQGFIEGYETYAEWIVDTVPIEMSGVSYARQRSRLCTACKGCGGCPIMEAAIRKLEDGVDATCTGCIPFERDYPEEAVAIVEAWAKEHTEETHDER